MLLQSGGYVVQQPGAFPTGSVVMSGMGPQTVVASPLTSSGRYVVSGGVAQTVIQPVTQQRMTVVSGGSDQLPSWAPPTDSRHSGQAAEAVHVAHTMRDEIGMMEDTVIELQRENEILKHRMLKERRGNLAKFFAADDRLLQQECLNEWLEFTQHIRHLRGLDQVNSMRSVEIEENKKMVGAMDRQREILSHDLDDAQKQDKDLTNSLVDAEGVLSQTEQENQHLQERIGALQQELAEGRAQEAETQASIEQLLKRLQKAEKIVKLLGEVSNFYSTDDTSSASRAGGSTLEMIMKEQLHGVLRETDANYIPSMDKLDTFGDHNITPTRRMSPIVRQRSLVGRQPVVPVTTQVVRQQWG